MSSMPYGTGRRPPGPGPKQGGGYGEDFPHPPSELMDQTYQRQLQGAPGKMLMILSLPVFCCE